MTEFENRAPLPNYEAWYEFTTMQCEISLTAAYCRSRMEELENLNSPSTKSFVQSYGDDYRMNVISWHEKAASMGS